jgi:hypothetical protein
MKHYRIISTHLPLLLVLGLTTFTVAQDKPTPQPATARPEVKHTWYGMIRRDIPEIKLQDVRFEDTIEYLNNMVSEKKLNIIVQWGSLQVDDPEIKDKKIKINLKDVPFGQGLQAVLNAAGGGIMELGYRFDGNVLTIDNRDKINSETFTRTYNVKDLIVYHEDDSLFEDNAASKRLRDIIVANVDRESWYPNGNGQIDILGDVVIITQTQTNQDAVAELLHKIREAGFRKLSPSPAAQAKQVKVRGQMLENMAETCFDPEIMGVAAVGGLRTETPIEPQDMIREYEEILSRITRQGIRNAIHLTLKDLYIETGNIPKAREHLKMIIEENDKAPPSPPKRSMKMRRQSEKNPPDNKDDKASKKS